MKIVSLDLFDLFGDGTLVMKTNVDEPDSAFRYAWYIKEDGKNIYKGHYQRNPYAAFQLKRLGSYSVKAYVRDGNGETVTAEAEFTATKKTSPQLAQPQKVQFTVTPSVSHVSGAFWQFSIAENFDNAKYAWYVYQEGSLEPVFKTPYDTESYMIHKFETPGSYFIKAFVIQDGVKRSARSQVFTVSL